MRITYVSHTRFPSEKAYGMQIAQVCNAMASLGHQVTLVAPDVRTTIEGDGHEYYGIAPTFGVQHIPTFDAINSPWVPGKMAFAVSMMTFRRQLRSFLQKHETDLLYVRSPMILPTLLAADYTVVLELHTLPRVGRSKFVRLCNKTGAIICLTSAMRHELEVWGVDPGRILVEPDGVNVDMFAELASRADAKHHWNLPSDRPVIGYAGSLVTQDVIEKGVRELVGAFGVIHQRGAPFQGWIVGGPTAQLARYQQQASQLALGDSVRFEGPIEPARVPSALRACDVLVYPAPASEHPYFQRDTSPLKLFEYMASGIPMVCADLPPLRDIVDESVVMFCSPGDPTSLANAIQETIAHPQEAQDRADRAAQRVQKYAWNERMKRVLEFSA